MSAGCTPCLTMASGSPSQASTPAGAEEAATYQLTLVAGEEIRLPIELREFDRLAEFENSVLECLSAVSAIDAFGCELDFVNLDTQVIPVSYTHLTLPTKLEV